jgi:hypothetical protein
MSHSLPRPGRLLAALGLGAALAGGLSCGDSSSPSAHTILDFIGAMTDGGGTVSAVRHTGSPPAAAGGPTVTVTGGGTVITGGSAAVNLAGSASFSTVIVAVDGVAGYYELTLPAPVTVTDVLLTLAQRIPGTGFDLQYGIGMGGGGLGAYQTVPVSVITVGTGEVQVSVSWNVDSDVDLHVVDPSGEEIYYANSTAASGGTLDLDSNPACSLDHVRNENITFPHAPSGSYTVRVDYYDACTQAQTDYVVTVQRKNVAPETFSGSFTGPGDTGGPGSGTLVTTFAFP